MKQELEDQPLLQMTLRARSASGQDAVELIETLKRELGADHPETLRLMHRVARAAAGGKEGERRIALLREVLSAREARLGPEDPLTLVTRADLGRHLSVNRRYDEAEPVLVPTRVKDVPKARAIFAGVSHVLVIVRD